MERILEIYLLEMYCFNHYIRELLLFNVKNDRSPSNVAI